ncbi:unnamed protein product [Brachionus calyciflorus]|uniref:Uncharacterized protein n=1 Tax=Brachionus calyciflorus TaxID=104777 RepID=A0A813YDT5_9BILA|nr:unnamed protein product [Brachionus calyciflorus]
MANKLCIVWIFSLKLFTLFILTLLATIMLVYYSEIYSNFTSSTLTILKITTALTTTTSTTTKTTSTSTTSTIPITTENLTSVEVVTTVETTTVTTPAVGSLVHGQTGCTENSQCKGYLSGTIICSTGTCSCLDNTRVYDSGTFMCKVKCNDNCVTNDDCITSICSSGICGCAYCFQCDATQNCIFNTGGTNLGNGVSGIQC